MPGSTVNGPKPSNIESELYLLIAKFLNSGVCQKAAEVLRKEIEEHELLPKRVDWLGGYHSRSFDDLEHILSHVSDDHLLKICSRIGPILDKEIPPTVPGLQSLLGVGRQSLLRTSEDLKKVKAGLDHLSTRRNGVPLYPSAAVLGSYPPNITKVLIARECSGPVSCRHVFSTKMHARMQSYRRMLGHLSSVYCVLFDRTGKYIFTGADDHLVKIWCATDGRLLASLRGHSAEITDMAVNYENTLLAAGSCDKTIRVWSLKNTSPIAVLSGHTAMVTSLQFCPYMKGDIRYLVSTGNDGCVCFWQWNPRNNTFSSKPVKCTERSKSGAQMICSSFSPGGVFLATGSTDHHVRIFNIACISGPEKILERESHSDRVDSIQFSNLDCRFVSGSKDGTALIWKFEKQNWSCVTLKMTTKLPGSQSEETEDSKVKLRVTMVGWTLDDQMVITAVSDYSVKVWNSRTGALCHVLQGHEDEVFVLEPHPTDPRVILSSGHDGRIILWDLVAGTLIKSHFNMIEGQGHGAVFDCKFSPDGQMFAATDSHGHISIYGFGTSDRFKKVPEEQFFHTDYRPLIRDMNHHVLDEQTQTPPHLLPAPFLVDIDGNPYPPSLQRLVPGREQCNESQLIPYVAADGAADMLEPVRPSDDADRPTIDDMIERLQQERNLVPPSHGGGSRSNSVDLSLSPRSNNQRSPRRAANESIVSSPFSPRSAQRAQSGHSRVGMRRTGDIEGVRQPLGNWQTRGAQSDANSWVRRVIVKPLSLSLLKFRHKRQVHIGESELAYYNREKKRQLIDMLQVSSRKQDERNVRRFEQNRLRRFGLRSRNTQGRRNGVYGEDYENPERLNFTSSSDTESDDKENLGDSVDEDSGSGEYSDWAGDVATKRNLRMSKPSTSGVGGPSTRHRRYVSSDDDDDDDDDSDNQERENHPKGKENDRVKRKKEPLPQKPQKKPPLKKKLPERFRPPEWLTDVMPHKAPYVPQVGDEVVYFRQGHELYVQAVKRDRIYDIYMRAQPWRQINLRDQEVAKILDMYFENHPPRLCCLKLTLLNPAGNDSEATFTVKYHDMADVIDFIVLKQNYDQAVCYNWKPGDRFRAAIDKAWWIGTIKSQKPYNDHYPDSPFQSFFVKWDNGEKELMSPWDFEPIDSARMPGEPGGSVEITPEEKMAMMYVPDRREWSSFGQEYDIERISRGLTRIMELSISEPFTAAVDLNRYPSYAIVVEYPMDLGTIRARLQNKFYRRLDAMKFDVTYIENNAVKFNEPGSRIVKQAKCVVDLCIKFIDSHNCHDPMILYHEMMEAKQSRSQDSQSELDVLCSESDSDDEHPSSSRMKRKKRQERILQSNKRLKVESLQYTSRSWRLQCGALLEEIIQNDDSTPFRLPVSLHEYPDYRIIIDCPMDLSTMKEKLETNQYGTPVDFCKDMRLIFQNSRNYNTNKRSRIYSMTIRMSAFFEEKIRSVISDWRSAVKYEEKLKNNEYVSDRRKPFSFGENNALKSDRAQRTAHSNKKVYMARPCSSRSSRSLVHSTKYDELRRNRIKKKLKAAKDEERTVSKATQVKKNNPMKHKMGSTLTNGIIKTTKTRREKITEYTKVRATESNKVRTTEENKVKMDKAKKLEKIKSHVDKKLIQRKVSDASSDAEEEEEEQEEQYDDDDMDDDYDGERYTVRKRTLPSATNLLKLRPRLKHRTHNHHTRSTSHFLRKTSFFRKRLQMPSRSHASPVRTSGICNSAPQQTSHPLQSAIQKFATLQTRSMRLPSSNNAISKMNSTVPLRRSVTPVAQTRLRQRKIACSDGTESDQSSKSEAASNNSTSASTSRSSRSQSSARNDHTYGRNNTSSSESESEESQGSEEENNDDDDDSPKRRSTRATTRDSTKATRSALVDANTMRPRRRNVLKRVSFRIQTRNCGQRTVRYGEESDEDNEDYFYQSDSENTEKVSQSSRGRLRKLIRHGKSLFAD